ncbi:MAG: TIR domain-containing protein [Bacteroidetes bacterium]|nr:MAG: TIR domain-containing protein [Bacteroidota bacterium]
MKIFISHSPQDQLQANRMEEALKQDGHEVFFDTLTLEPGDNMIKKVNEALRGVEVIIMLISENSLQSKQVKQEIQSITLNDISRNRTRVLPVKIDACTIPGYLSDYQLLDLSKDWEYGLRKLREGLKDTHLENRRVRREHASRNEQFIHELSQALKNGNLTLICGAGVSIGAGIPSWENLLLRLLESMMVKISNNHAISLQHVQANEFQKRMGPSSLVMGKYLKSNLGKDFLPELREALYQGNPQTCGLVDAIVEVCRPQREGKPLDSIITFNFDALIEENLEKNNIRYKAIDKEGIRNHPNELPIYHVHGYLPRTGDIPPETEIVFSEDAYHTQFIEPFSWSNLIQLTKLAQNTCLLIGLSLTDPNIRRLLDVANRKETSNKLNHYLIKKKPSIEGSAEDTIDELMLLLEEQDANELGLNVIWVDDFDDIPPLICKMLE